MPTLLETQRALSRSLVAGDDGPAAALILADGLAPEARLNIYRNTFIGTLTTALRLSFPAVHRLVGADFFESAARIFIDGHPPQSAYLDDYGAAFAEFLADFQPAASLPYLAGVARLEWAVSRALHAPDAPPLALSRLAAVDPADHGRIVFTPHPSLGLVVAGHPVDAIWRAVLAQDDAAMAAIDLGAGPVWLRVQRQETGIEVQRIGPAAWAFTMTLRAGMPLQVAMDAVPDLDSAALLAGYLTAGCFVDFELPEQPHPACPQETPL